MSNSSLVTEIDALPGLNSAKRLVKRIIEQGERVHAVLLYGAEGAGKSQLARSLTCSWLCAKGGCGECQACIAFNHGRSADVLEISPKSSNWIRLASIRPQGGDEDEISIIEFLRTMPLMSRHKVVIMRAPDRMTRDAANALLKTLEEPPEYAKFILISSAISGVLPTILSRCVTVQCESAGEAELKAEGVDARLIKALETPGRIAEVQAHEQWFADLLSFATSLPTRRKTDALKVSEELAALSDRRKEEFDEPARTANAETLRLLAGLISDRPDWVSAVTEAHRLIVGNGNAALVFDALFAKGLGSASRRG